MAFLTRAVSAPATPPAGAGETNLGANVGAGAQVFRDKTGVTLNFRTLVGVGDVTVTQVGDTVEFDLVGPIGEDNLAANVGGATGTVFRDKTGVDTRGIGRILAISR